MHLSSYHTFLKENEVRGLPVMLKRSLIIVEFSEREYVGISLTAGNKKLPAARLMRDYICCFFNQIFEEILSLPLGGLYGNYKRDHVARLEDAGYPAQSKSPDRVNFADLHPLQKSNRPISLRKWNPWTQAFSPWFRNSCGRTSFPWIVPVRF